MNIAWKRLFVLLVIILLLLSAACAPAVTGPELSAPEPSASPDGTSHDPVIHETPPAAASQQPSATGQQPSATDQQPSATGQQPSAAPQESVQPGTGTDNETKDPPRPVEPGKPSGQDNQATEMPQGPEEPAEPQNSPPPEPTTDVSPALPDDGPVILTITGGGVNTETTWTLDQLQALRDGYRELTYSTTNNWPSFSAMTAQGISLTYLLRQAGITGSAASIKFISTDGFHTTLTYNQVFGTLYSYTSHSATGSSGASAVEPVIAWVWGDVGKARPENIRPFFGQSGPWEVNTSAFVKDLCKIEVLTTSAGIWAVPGSTVADGSKVSPGTELELTHSSMDNVRIYYTIDGSEPGYGSSVYNPSTSYFQPALVKPLILTESVTIKAFAAGLGKEKSAVVTLVITVE